MAGGSDIPLAGEEQRVRLEVPARPGYVVLARLALSAVCRLTGLGDEEVADLKLAITEAATIFVGNGEGPPGPLEAAPEPEEEGTLRFAFELHENELTVEVGCDSEVDLSEQERELSHAIIAATVDRCESGPGRVRLVKSFARSGG